MKTAKIRSLVYREMRNYVPELRGQAAVLGILSGIFLLLLLSLRFGNLAKVFEGDDDSAFELRYYLSFLGTTLISISVCGLFTLDWRGHIKDIRSNWLRYSYTLPVSPKERVLAGFLAKTGMLAIGLMIGVLISLLFSAVSGYPLQPIYAAILLFGICYSVILDCSMSFFIRRERTVKRAIAAQPKSTIAVGIILFLALVRFIKPIQQMLPEPDDGVPDLKQNLNIILSEYDKHAHTVIPVLLVIIIVLYIADIAINYYCMKTFDNGRTKNPETETAERIGKQEAGSLHFFGKKASK